MQKNRPFAIKKNRSFAITKFAIGDGISWTFSMQAKAQPEAQLGAREAKAMSLGGSVVAIAYYSPL